MKIEKSLALDINSNLKANIDVKQDDVKSRFVSLQLTDQGKPLDLTNHDVRVYMVKIDGNKIFNDVTIVNSAEGKILIELTSQSLNAPGLVAAELSIYGQDKSILSSRIFYINVLRSLRNDSAIESSNEFTALTNALNDIEQAKENVGIIGHINEELKDNIRVGKESKSSLDNSISSATDLKNNLDSSIGSGTKLKVDLLDSIDTATELETDLNKGITEGYKVNLELKNNINDATTLKGDIASVTASATDINGKLVSNVKTATDINGKLETNIPSAQQKNEELKKTINTADTITYATKGDFNNVSSQLIINATQL